MTNELFHKEKDLLHRIAQNDQRAFKELFDQYWEHLYIVAITLVKSPEQARDMVQEIFMKVWLLRKELPEKENFRNFLFVVARNYILNELRKKSREEPFFDHIISYFTEKAAEADQPLLYKESEALIQQAIAQLPEQQRLVYQLTREQGLSQDEIAEKLLISKTTVKTHMSRALAAIREHLGRHADPGMVLLCLIKVFL